MHATADDEELTIVEVAANGSFQDIEALLMAGKSVKVKRQTDGRTALHEAAKKGDTRIARLLIVNSAEIDARDNEQYTPLHYAASYGHLECVKLLVESGASLSAKADGETALQKAKICNHDSTVNYLLSVMQTKGQSSSSSSSTDTQSRKAASSSSNTTSKPPPSTTLPSSASSSSSQHHQHHHSENLSSLSTRRGEQTALVICGEEILGVVDFDKDVTLAQIRKQLRDDEVVGGRGMTYRFFFKDTGAPVTEKQEMRFKATECMVQHQNAKGGGGAHQMPAFLISKPTKIDHDL